VVPSAEGAQTTPSIAVIINPISGTGGRIDVARARAAQAAALLQAHGADPSNVFLTERGGHARELALNAIGRGISTVVSWGGDGTMNEVGTALAFTGVSLALVPSGSGNGLARELGVPFDPRTALEVALRDTERTIDAGEIDGRLFFNIAGVGLDARVAHQFAVHGMQKRGFARYINLTLRELTAYRPEVLTVTTPAASVCKPSLLVAIANGRQYGNGAVVAPHARLDDGRLDVITINARSLVRASLELPFVFLGMIDRVAGITMETTEAVTIASPSPIVYHLDGEPIAGTLGISAKVRPGALRIKVPAR
jgi:YegS/Rv2252/BmrU family lipid kinase